MNDYYHIPQALQHLIGSAAIVVRSPGRINLIGEHTDYNNGFVLPAAINKAVYVAIEKNNFNKIALYSSAHNESFEVSINDIRPIPGHWSVYILGVVDQLIKSGLAMEGFNLAIYGNVPLGAGLSSSAAVECATAFALNEMLKFEIEKIELAKIAQQAEHEFAGVKCGIMDQFASLFGEKDNVIKLDCRSMEYEYFPLKLNGYKIVLFDSQVKHSLASTEYNVRRRQCEEGVAIIKQQYPEVKSLRDVSLVMIEECLTRLPVIYNRCRYVVEENIRLEKGCNDLLNGNINAFGQKMFATHKGLSEQYEVSCKELDFLAMSAQKIPGVIGARMMGGGFGGCTINIIDEEKAASVIDILGKEYREIFEKDLKPYEVEIEDGTSRISLS